MARRKKQLPDPRQLSLFDLFATQAEELREEAREEDFTPLGQNLKGEWVYVQREDNARMHSKDPSICRFIDGEKDSPEELFRKRKHDFLTREELASFEEREKRAALNSLPLFTEAQHVGSSDSPIGNSQSDSEAGNNLGNSPEPAGLRPDGVSNSGSLGTQSTGRIEGSGGIRSADSPSVRAAGDGGGRAGLTDGGRNGILLNGSPVSVDKSRRAKANEIAYAYRWFKDTQGRRGCVFADAKAFKPSINAADDGFRRVVGVLSRTPCLGIFCVRQHTAQGRVLFGPRGMLGVKDLRQATPTHIAS